MPTAPESERPSGPEREGFGGPGGPPGFDGPGGSGDFPGFDGFDGSGVPGDFTGSGGPGGSEAPGWHGRRVLVTGATGFIGARLVERLAALGARVHAVSRRPGRAAEHGRTWHVADVGDTEAAGALVRSVRPDVVFHLASEVAGTRDPRLVPTMLRGNLASVVNLLTAVAEDPGARVVLAGSVEELRPDEADAVPSSPYAAAKWAARGYALMFHRLWDVPVTNLRVAMVYGQGERNLARLVPYMALSLLRGREPALSSGKREIDWIHVDDVVEAFLAAATTPEAAGRSLDVGSGTRTTIRDTAELLVRITGGVARPRYGALPDRPLDSARIADIGPTADVLGWRPVIGLEDGLRRTVAWYADRLRAGEFQDAPGPP
ncbi:NAD-dependent epimerase/dehydratase family protein [Streptosporangium sandarakinum]|uniref:NAD-dependent epimerase/dehydratase family protein n=1 Tax=Streptosporangium sandarakinum TaxID=1260955 RepID=UPI003440337C